MCIPMVTCGVTPSGVTCTYPWLHVVLHPVVLHVHTHGYMWCYTQWCYMCIPMVTCGVTPSGVTCAYPWLQFIQLWCYMYIPMVTCGVTCTYPWSHVVLHVDTHGYMWCYMYIPLLCLSACMVLPSAHLHAHTHSVCTSLCGYSTSL